jgi:hypothetical protein
MGIARAVLASIVPTAENLIDQRLELETRIAASLLRTIVKIDLHYFGAKKPLQQYDAGSRS